MLKKFVTVFLGSMAAIWLSILIGFLLIVFMVGSLAGGFLASNDSPLTVHNKSVLVLDLNGTISEREIAGSLKEQIMGSEQASGSLCEYIEAIDKAASDKRIEGMLIKCNGSSLGTASRQELIEAITRFRDKKFVIAYGDYYSQGDYFVACAANELYVNPVGAVDIHGIASSTPFFTGLLEKLGIKMQIVKVGKFKSAVEPFILKNASEASILQTKTYIDGVWNEISSYIASRRATSPDSVTAWAAGIAAFYTPQRLIADSIVDRLAYEREINDILKKRIGLKEKDDLNTISVNDYLSASSITESDKIKDSKHIAVYYAVGDIVDSGSKGIVSSVVAPDIIKLADDENVAGLILRVNSGGGSAFASEQIWEAVEYFKSKDKPVYASMSDVAASGGYYISCGADRIYADPATLTGSIGIFGMIPCFEGLVTDKLGINFTTVESNPNAALLDPFRQLPVAQLDAMQKMVEHGYDTFVSRVAAGRHISADSVKVIGEGRVWYGRDALHIGLVDTLASLHTAKAEMTASLHLSSDKTVDYPAIEYPVFMQILRMIEQQNALAASVMSTLENTGITINTDIRNTIVRISEILTQISSGSPIQARAEDIQIH